MDEFLIENSTFTHAKTIDSKDNRLFLGNVKNELSEYLNDYDTRAFRFGTMGFSLEKVIKVKLFESDVAATSYTINSDSDYANIPSDSDAIPLYNLDIAAVAYNDDPLYDHNQKYQRVSAAIGGEGRYIKYRFGVQSILSDSTANMPANEGAGDQDSGTSRDDTGTYVGIQYPNGYRVPGSNFSSLDILQVVLKLLWV
jgi:hypothetical protein